MVNDASTDDSSRVCHKYAARDNRIIVIDKPRNEGLELARRSGLDIARGRYVMHVDSDDWLDNRYVLSTMYRTAEETGADYVEIGMQRVFDRHKWIKKKHKASVTGLIEQPELMDKYFLSFFGVNILPVNIWGKLYRKSCLDRVDIKPAGVYMGEDLAYNVQLFPHLRRIFIIDATGYNYRYGGGTGGYNRHLLPDIKRLYELRWQLIQKYRYDKAADYMRIELKNVLKTAICRQIEHRIGVRDELIRNIMTEIDDPLYKSMLLVDENSGFWKDPFVQAYKAGDAEALYEICRQIVRGERPKLLLKRVAFGLLSRI